MLENLRERLSLSTQAEQIVICRNISQEGKQCRGQDL
jgi:hypothetical protein